MPGPVAFLRETASSMSPSSGLSVPSLGAFIVVRSNPLTPQSRQLGFCV
ncbi:hypothetical protein SBADM41S_02697 [Streptomyces badius]